MPQFIGSFTVFDSQPFAYFMSQSLKPFRQPVMTHIELAQAMLAFGTAAHLALQPPQLLMSVAVLASQPFMSMLSQLEKPMLHCAMVHLPAMHAACAFARLHLI